MDEVFTTCFLSVLKLFEKHFNKKILVEYSYIFKVSFVLDIKSGI